MTQATIIGAENMCSGFSIGNDVVMAGLAIAGNFAMGNANHWRPGNDAMAQLTTIA